MKLSSSAAVLLGAAVVAFPGASAATVSLRGGILPDKETSIEFINCNVKTDCRAYGINTCERIEQQCDGQCVWVGNFCEDGDIRRVGPPRRPVVSVCEDFRNFNQCDRTRCFWDGSSCRSDVIRTGPVCRDFGNARTCEFDGLCIWDSGLCVPAARAVPRPPIRGGSSCRSIFDRKQCKHKTDGDCYWDDFNGCNPYISEDEEEDLVEYEEEEQQE